MHFIKKFFTNSLGILVSRIFGFIRDLLMASTLGASIYSDIFFVAFKFPNLFRRIFAEGAFTQVFIPSFIKSRYKSIFTVSILIRFLTFISIFTIFVWMFSEFFTSILALGFSEKLIKLAAPYVGINFTYLILIFIVTFISTLLQYKNHFATTAFSTALLNISMIIALLSFGDLSQEKVIWYLSLSVVIGGFLQVFVHIFTLYRLRLFKIFYIGFSSLGKKANTINQELKKFNNSFIPAILGNSTAQIAAFLDTWLATFLSAGSISYLYYSNRVFQLPLALFAIALSVSIFPKIAKLIKKNNLKDANNLLAKSFWFLTFILSIATVGGIMLSDEIVYLLFQRGEFSNIDTINTSKVLIMYMIGLVPFGLSKIFLLWVYSTHKQKIAAKIAMYSLVGNVLLSIILIVPMQAAGLALASSLSGFILFIFVIKEFGFYKFYKILNNKYIFYLLFVIVLEIWVLISIKNFITPYINS